MKQLGMMYETNGFLEDMTSQGDIILNEVVRTSVPSSATHYITNSAKVKKNFKPSRKIFTAII